MAGLKRCVISEMMILSRGLQFGLKQGTANQIGVRHLYAEAALGVDNYVRTRDRIKTQFLNISDKFRLKMNEFSEPNSTNLIFTEDLKNMVHLVEAKSSDVDLIIKMMKRFNEQNKELRFGNFVFGPVVMRMFYYLNEPQIALDSFKSTELSGFFDQLISYQILMDLLFKNEMYNEILDVFAIIKAKQMQDAKYPKNVIVLTFAACYKLNTPESLKFATHLWKTLQEVGHIPLRRATTFAAALAVKQNSPHIALEIISSVRQQNYITVRNLKVAALADIGRPDDALPILRSVLETDDPEQRKQTFTKDVISKLQASFERSENKDAAREFVQLEKSLREHGHITDNALEEHLCSEINMVTPSSGQGRDRRFLAASFTRQPTQQRPRSYNRPGLEDLH